MNAVYRDIDPTTVVVLPMTTEMYQSPEWLRRFVGSQVGVNPDGTLRVLAVGPVDDLTRSVFLKALDSPK